MSTTTSSITCDGLVISSGNSLTLGGGTAITKILKGTVSVTLAATAAAAEEDVSLTISGAAAGDIVFLTPTNTAMETGVAVIGAWVSAADTVKVRITNVNAANALAGTTQSWSYLIVKS